MISKNQLLNQDTFIIFGAGNTGTIVNTILKSVGKKVAYFLVTTPSPPHTQVSESAPVVISLEETKQIHNKNIPVIIAVFNREKNSNISSIVTLLEQLGFTQIITYFEFHEIFADEIGDIFWLTKSSFYKANLDKYNQCLSLFKDEHSRKLYSEIIDFLQTFNPQLLSEPDLDHQYFPPDLTVWDGKKAFIDIGTYDGQNIIDQSGKFGVLSKVIAFEPDPENFKKINCNINWTEVAEEAILFPCGVWEKTQMLHFSSGDGESGTISDQGDIIIPVVSLDEVLKGIIPGFIKMDIEGAEIAALKGAKEIITDHKPSLAISIYHTPGHLFEIPLLLNSWDLDYKFYLRFHGHNLFDTVLYCIF